MPVGSYYGHEAYTLSVDYHDDMGNHNSYVVRILRRPHGTAEITHSIADREEILGFSSSDLSVVDQNGIMYLVVTPQGSVTGEVQAYILRTSFFTY